MNDWTTVDGWSTLTIDDLRSALETMRDTVCRQLQIPERFLVKPAPIVDADEATLWAALDKHPGDLLYVSILADWLEERSDPRAEALRWAVRMGKNPTGEPWTMDGMGWHCGSYAATGEDRPGRMVARHLMCRMTMPAARGHEMVILITKYKKRSDAYRALAAAFLACRAAGIDPLTGEKVHA